MTAREDIVRKLGAYRARLRSSFRHGEKRLALVQLLRCIDYKTFVEYIYERAGEELPFKDDARNVGRLFSWGWNEALSLFWDDSVAQEGVPLLPTVPQMKDWGDALLQGAGRLRMIELLLELERLNLGNLVESELADSVYHLYLSETATGVEGVERKDGDYINVLLKRMHEKDRVWEELERRRGPIMDQMSEIVEPFEKHYIRYDAKPQIDSYYNDLSVALAPTRSGWDTFPQQAVFGGIPFAKYIECVRVIMGFALKHLDFCLLLGNRGSVRPIDTLAVPCDWKKACGYVARALDVPEAESEQLMQSTIITSANATHHFATPSGPFASHYMIGRGAAVRLITGCLDNPFHFMLRELRRSYPKDWDSSVDAREAVFREELIALFSHIDRLICFSDNVNITTEIGKTDIDAIVVDPIENVAGLFQLKWQDQFAGSMRERESRKANFLKNGNRWVEKVSTWVTSGRMPQTLVSLRLPKHLAQSIERAHLFVIGRNFSHFSGEFAPDARAAWGNWAQLLRLFESPAEGISPLGILYDQIKLDSPISRSKLPAKIEEIKIDGLKVLIHFPGGEK